LSFFFKVKIEMIICTRVRSGVDSRVEDEQTRDWAGGVGVRLKYDCGKQEEEEYMPASSGLGQLMALSSAPSAKVVLESRAGSWTSILATLRTGQGNRSVARGSSIIFEHLMLSQRGWRGILSTQQTKMRFDMRQCICKLPLML
jgi:hypothetical protein